MKILHIIPFLEMGGAERLVSDMLPLMKTEYGVEVRVAVFRKSNTPFEQRLIDNGIEIIHLDYPLRSFKSIPKITQLIKASDIVHAHLFPINYLVAIANLFSRKTIIFTEHSTFNKRRLHKWLRPIEKAIYSQYSAITCISNETASSLTDWIGKKITNKKNTIIQNGIDLERFEKETSFNPELMFGKKGIPLLMISRFSKPKDHSTVVRALKLINRQDVYVVFVGDGEKKNEIKELSDILNLTDRIIFLGLRSDIPSIVKNAYIGIQSSHWEGFGLSAIELMAGGIPVIASDVEGLAQVVNNSGLLFEKGNEKDLASKIQYLLNDKEVYDEFSKASKRRASDYSIKKTVSNYICLYRKFIHS